MEKLVPQGIEEKIIQLPGRSPAMLDRDVAELFEVETRVLNQAFKRNKDGIPDDWVFKPTKAEFMQLKTNITRGDSLNSSKWDGPYPLLYTRPGVNIMAAYLQSPIAKSRLVQIMDAFSQIEQAGGMKAIIGRAVQDALKTYTSPDVAQKIQLVNRIFEVCGKPPEKTLGAVRDSLLAEATRNQVPTMVERDLHYASAFWKEKKKEWRSTEGKSDEIMGQILGQEASRILKEQGVIKQFIPQYLRIGRVVDVGLYSLNLLEQAIKNLWSKGKIMPRRGNEGKIIPLISEEKGE